MSLAGAQLVAFVASTNLNTSRTFYEGILGLRLVSENPFALVFDVGGVPLRIVAIPTLSPAPHTVLGWQVADLRQTLGDLAQVGIEFERYAGLEQDAQGIWQSPSGARVAWFRDPDGNVLSLTQPG